MFNMQQPREPYIASNNMHEMLWQAELSFTSALYFIWSSYLHMQAKFKSLHSTIMTVFFSLTTPMGVAIGIGISNVYGENTPTALIVQGIFNSASAGILIYMALVDLLAADFMDQRMQSNARLQVAANISLLLGASCMSVLAIWA